ncbi:uroporphyrinogen-III synthase [Drosophila pseudoobscura]|uniref:Uroporphyrinogen-III synthase n=1 Tax=Drosophila pseudoobscura pseudoobscura TaxID=46245 RepID=A0A6I8UQR4_DROPS|nr:uroporphyrinogen-III synthase [Drosophila pseudoobscura]
MANRQKRIVILLKGHTADYDRSQAMRQSNLSPIYIPPSQIVMKNLGLLKAKLEAPHRYAGIIFPGPRSVQAVYEALGNNGAMPNCWRALHNYALGASTHSRAYMTLRKFPTLGDRVVSAHNLCDLIVETIGPKRDLPLLLPYGNEAGNTLRIRLMAQGFRVDSCEVYENQIHPNFTNDMKKVLKAKQLETIVFHSLASVRSASEFFSKYKVSVNDRKLIAVGAAAQKAMEEAKLPVSAVVNSYSVDQLIKAIKK